MFDFRKLEAFCKVCELRSFSKAGEVLFLSQPTISAHVQNLEREMGVRLLDRMGRTVLPTPAGEALYRHATQAFRTLESAKEEVHSLAGTITGDLLLGSSSIPAHYMLPEIMTLFLGKHPHVRPILMIASSRTILQKVLEGELMAGIVGCASLPDADLAFTPLMDDEIIGIASAAMVEMFPPTFPEQTAKKKQAIQKNTAVSRMSHAQGASASTSHAQGLILPEISFEQAHILPWIMREATSTTRCAFEDAVRTAGHDPRLLTPRLLVDSSHTAVQYVEAGLGVGVASLMTVKELLQQGTLRGFRLSGVYATRHFSSVVHTRRVPFPTAAAFLEMLHANTAIYFA